DILYQNQPYTGTVVQTPSSAPSQENKVLQEKNSHSLFIEFDSTVNGIEIGKTARIEIITNVAEDALIIPKTGLHSYMARRYVQVLNGDSLRQIDVEVGISTNTEVEIKDGLEEGQQVVLQ